MITAILAQSRDNIIGTTGPNGPCLPWRLPPDLRRFKALTEGHAVIMGRTTFESIGRPLPNRRNIVLSRGWDNTTIPRDVFAARSPDRAIEVAACFDPNPFIIGGGEVYAALWPHVDRVEFTRVDTLVGLGRVFGWDESQFREVECSPWQEHEGLRFQFVTLERRTA